MGDGRCSLWLMDGRMDGCMDGWLDGWMVGGWFWLLPGFLEIGIDLHSSLLVPTENPVLKILFPFSPAVNSVKKNILSGRPVLSLWLSLSSLFPSAVFPILSLRL